MHYLPRPSPSSRFYHPNNIWRGVYKGIKVFVATRAVSVSSIVPFNALHKITESPCLNVCNQFQGWHICTYIFVDGPAFGKPEGKFTGWDCRHLVAILRERRNLSKQLGVKFQPHVCLFYCDMQSEELICL